MNIEYNILYKTPTGTMGIARIYAKDRKDAMTFFKNTYRKLGHKVISARAVKSPKPEPKPAPVLTEQESFVNMLQQAYNGVNAAPYSGVAIGKYLKLFMATNPNSVALIHAIAYVIRQVDNYNETLTQNKKL